MVMNKLAGMTVEKVSANLRSLADLIEAIENEKVTPEMQQIAQEIDTRALAPDMRTLISFVAGTESEALEYMNGDFRSVLERTRQDLFE
ncbi:MAG: hypothetical protein DWQ07_17500 [Chloroflexi bacterium]|nr:MAG: hypothetical protein DWQ07_17500 [Chloroflexota bacterium]